jgi:PhnB protein
MPSAPAHVLAPYLVVKGGVEAIDFYKKVFGFEELFRLVDPNDGRVGHAELQKGNAIFMLADEYPDFGAFSPESLGGTPVRLHLYVEDADSVVQRAVDNGATVLRPVKDEFYGDRTGTIVDPFGHSWVIASRREDVSADEMQRRWNEAMTS